MAMYRRILTDSRYGMEFKEATLEFGDTGIEAQRSILTRPWYLLSVNAGPNKHRLSGKSVLRGVGFLAAIPIVGNRHGFSLGSDES